MNCDLRPAGRVKRSGPIGGGSMTSFLDAMMLSL
jgi:hypothetical protein